MMMMAMATVMAVVMMMMMIIMQMMMMMIIIIYRICMHSCIFDKVISILYKIIDHVISVAFGSVQYIKLMYELPESSSSMMMTMMM